MSVVQSSSHQQDALREKDSSIAILHNKPEWERKEYDNELTKIREELKGMSSDWSIKTLSSILFGSN